MSELSTCTIPSYYAAVLAVLSDVYGERLATIAPYDAVTLDDPSAPLSLPAVYLRISALQGDDDARQRQVIGRTPTRASCVLYLVVATDGSAPQIALDTYASSIHALIREQDPDPRLDAFPGNRWGLGAAVGAPESASVLDVESSINGCIAREIVWDQLIYLPSDPIDCLAEPEEIAPE